MKHVNMDKAFIITARPFVLKDQSELFQLALAITENATEKGHTFEGVTAAYCLSKEEVMSGNVPELQHVAEDSVRSFLRNFGYVQDCLNGHVLVGNIVIKSKKRQWFKKK